MTAREAAPKSAQIRLSSPKATERLGQRVAEQLVPGDVILIEGPIGAGKSHFCRAVIRSLLAKEGRSEDIPSPTFTLVQTYELRDMEVWHADLYRLTGPGQASELGLDEAFETAVVLIEWPDRLADGAPKTALRLRLALVEDDAESRLATLTATAPRWQGLLSSLPVRDEGGTDG